MEIIFKKNWNEEADAAVIQEIQDRGLVEPLRVRVGHLRPTKGMPSRNSINEAPDNPDTPTARIVLREARTLLELEDIRIETARRAQLPLPEFFVPGRIMVAGTDMLEPNFG